MVTTQPTQPLRAYQAELLALAKSENVIVHLDTGTRRRWCCGLTGCHKQVSTGAGTHVHIRPPAPHDRKTTLTPHTHTPSLSLSLSNLSLSLILPHPTRSLQLEAA